MSTIATEALVRQNLQEVRERVANAARRSHRDPTAVTIVAVTKSVGVREAGFLLEAGHRDLGENRPESLATRAADPSLAGARWHLIGSYQRRKVKDTLERVFLVHSLHSFDLARAISFRAAELGRAVRCLVQVNVSGEASKQGFDEAGVRAALDVMRVLPQVELSGLMTMAPEKAPLDECRRIFAATRALRDRLRDAELPLAELSMGMSRDYAEAVLEGATLVRVGTRLFQPEDGRDTVA